MADTQKHAGAHSGASARSGPGSGNPHVLDRFAIVVKYYKAVVVVFVLVVAGMMHSAYTTVPMYRATARVVIEPEESTQSAINDTALVYQDPEPYYQTQYRIIQGRELARRVVRRLELQNEPEFNGRGPEPTKLTQTLSFIKAKLTEPFGGSQTPPPPTAPATTENALVSAFLSRIDVASVRGTLLVDIGFRSARPEFAAKAANALAEEYIKQNLEQRLGDTGKTLEWLNEEVARQQAAVQAREREMAQYREDTNTPLDDNSNIVVSRMTQLNDAYTRARTERIQAEIAYKQVQEATDKSAVTAVASNPSVQNLRSRLTELENEQSKRLERYGERHPDVININAQVTETRKQVDAEVAKAVETIRNVYEAAVQNEKSIAQDLDGARAAVNDLGRRSVDYSVLQREVESDRQVYESLLAKQKELAVATNSRANNVRVLDDAQVPGAPYTPDIPRAWTMALLLGLGLGVAAAFVIDYLDDTVKTPDDVRWKLKLPFLGVVPKVAGNERPLLTDTVPPHFGEAFRALRTSLVNASGDTGTKIIVTTSSQPLEGKTTTAVNMALSLAIGGARVLVIDADMRRPSVHKALKIPNGKGLSELLAEQTKLRDLVQRTVHPNLVAITAGSIPPNPSELLASDRMKTFLRQLSQSPFDWVFIDTPPVLAVTDAVILAPLVSGVTFVVGAEMTRWRMAERAVETLQGGQPRSIAAVLNRVDLERNRYYYWRYYGHQNYGYYGETQKAAS